MATAVFFFKKKKKKKKKKKFFFGCDGTPKLRALYPRWPQGFRPFSLYHAGWRLPVAPPIRLRVNPRQLPPSTLPRLSISMKSRSVPPMRVAAPAHRYSEQRIRRPDRALLAPQPAPDCEFRGADDLKPVDPDQWARLKLDYERQCYQKASRRPATVSSCCRRRVDARLSPFGIRGD